MTIIEKIRSYVATLVKVKKKEGGRQGGERKRRKGGREGGRKEGR
jgi:hypothetical protein